MEAASPSLRRPPEAGGAASKPQPFHFDAENNDDLPDLLVAGLVGNQEHDEALRIFCQLNKRMHRAAHAALDVWLEALTNERQAMVDSERARSESIAVYDVASADQHDRRAAVHQFKLQGMLTQAFGDLFPELFGCTATHCSVYSPKVYAAMRQRRCVLCHRCMSAGPRPPYQRASLAEVSFTFAHFSCQQRCHVVLGNRSPMKTALELCTHDRTIQLGSGGTGESASLKDERAMITCGFRRDAPRCIWKALAVYHLTPEHVFNPSNLWRSLERARQADRPAHAPETAGEVHWVLPIDGVIKREDTMIGALGVDDVAVAGAVARASTYARDLVEARARREEERLDIDAKRRVERRGQAAARVGLMHSQGTSPWATIAELERVHPLALSRVGLITYMDCGRNELGQAGSLNGVSGRIVFLARLCNSPPINKETLDYLMQCDEAWRDTRRRVGFETAISVVDDRMISFAKFLDGVTPQQVWTGDVSSNWRFRLVVTPPAYTVDTESLWARVHNPVTIKVLTDHGALRQARAALEALGCVAPIPSLTEASYSPQKREAFLKAVVDCALETPLADGTVTRKARHIAYKLLRMDLLLAQWRREMALQTKHGAQQAHAAGHVHFDDDPNMDLDY